MKFYCLSIAPDVGDAEGTDRSEWFTSREAVWRRRSALIAADPSLAGHRYGQDFSIDCVTVAPDVTEKQLLLAILNRKGWVAERVLVASAYVPPKATQASAEG